MLIYLELIFYARQEFNFTIFQSDSHLLNILTVPQGCEIPSYLYIIIWDYDIHVFYIYEYT